MMVLLYIFPAIFSRPKKTHYNPTSQTGQPTLLHAKQAIIIRR